MHRTAIRRTIRPDNIDIFILPKAGSDSKSNVDIVGRYSDVILSADTCGVTRPWRHAWNINDISKLVSRRWVG